jgi:uncharacterized membrane protein YphA (DoxX/SURF4 family)
MTARLASTWWTLRIALGATAFLAGLDKFFNLLADWPSYLSPLALSVVPVSAATFMHAAGIIEIAAGLALLAGFTRLFGYIVSAWLVGISLNLLTTGHYLDVAVRDLNMAVAAFALAKLTEAREAASPQRLSVAA